MNEANAASTRLETALRRLHADLDAAPGFEARLAARLATATPAPSPAERAQQRARLALEHQTQRAALVRRLRSRLALATLGGALALAAVWAAAPQLGPRLAALSADGPTSPVALAALALLALVTVATLSASLGRAAPWADLEPA